MNDWQTSFTAVDKQLTLIWLVLGYTHYSQNRRPSMLLQIMKL